MKKLLEIFGLSILICFSFFLTEKTSNLIKNNDFLMTTIQEKSKELEISSIDAIIEEDEIIPGINGKVIDIEKSYQAMKKVGTYHLGLLVYKEIEPTISIKGNYDKYVVNGNKNKKMVSFIFKVEENTQIDNILKVLENYKIRSNFFIDGKWLEKNSNMLKEISIKNHVIGNLGYFQKYEQENNYWMVTNIKRNTNQNQYYCYCEEKNDSILKLCADNKEYTILPKIVISNNLLLEVKKIIEPGIIISIEINENTENQLSNMIDFVISKGYQIVNLDKLLEE